MSNFIDVTDESGSLTADVLKARRFTANGIRYDNIEGEGCIGHALNIDYLGTMALVRPSMFLAMTPAGGIRSTDYIASLEAPFGTPYLEVSIFPDGDRLPAVREHEGRSRMSAILRKHGDVPVPICLFFSVNGYGLRAREIEADWIERAAEGVIRENRGGPREWVPGPVFEQVIYFQHGTDPLLMSFGAEGPMLMQRR